MFQFYKETEDGKFIFMLTSERWTRDYFSRRPVMPHEEFLQDVAGDNNWYYGGNRYLTRYGEQDRGLVVTDLTAAMAFRMSAFVTGDFTPAP